MTTSLRFAASQFPVSKSMESNCRYILRHMSQASGMGVDIVHFPEAALPGYIGRDISTFSGFDWQALDRHSKKIKATAKIMNIWVVVGSCRQVSAGRKPRNCLHIISRDGEIVATYDKRRLYGKEAASYSEGARPLTLNINGVKCGFLICYESCFPSLYESYRKKGVQLLFHSYYNARNEVAGTSLDDLMLAQLRTRAADHEMWISASNSSARHSRLPACIARPDGSVRSTKRHVAGIVFHNVPDKTTGWTYDNRK
ncbi:carbon-nitrogen hydrolase family protein [Acidobacteriota bacterium]